MAAAVAPRRCVIGVLSRELRSLCLIWLGRARRASGFQIILNYAFFPRKDFQIPSLNKILAYSLIFYFSFERYIRICYYCQLRETSVLSENNVKFYKLFVILFPILFYVPQNIWARKIE